MSTTTSSRNKNLIFIITVLLLTNIAVLVYFLAFKDRKRTTKHSGIEQRERGAGMDERLKKEVGFSDQQVAQFKQLKEEQKIAIRPYFEAMRRSKDSLFALMGNESANDSIINNAANVIAQRQKELDLQTFAHFKRVRDLCTPEQKPKFDTLMHKFFSKMGKQGRRGEEKAERKDTN